MKKFELTTETKINIFGKKLFRIKALISFGPISAGEKGGWVEKEENLSQSGNAWVFGNAEVYDNACDECTCTYESCSCKLPGSKCAYETDDKKDDGARKNEEK